MSASRFKSSNPKGGKGKVVSAPVASYPIMQSFDSALWTDMDSGVGLWDNIPGTIRQAFRALLSIAQSQAQTIATIQSQTMSQHDDIAEKLDEEIEVLKAQQSKHDATIRKLTLDNQSLTEKTSKLESELVSKPDEEPILRALQTKADKANVADVEQAYDAIRQDIHYLEERINQASDSHTKFEEEAKNGIIAATRAANEARSAVSTSLSAFALHESSYVNQSMLSVVQEELSALGRDVTDARALLDCKADIKAVNEILETKANKSTVAQALHNKVSVSKMPDFLSSHAEKIAALEKDIAVLQSKQDNMPAERESAVTRTLFEEKLRNLELRLGSRVDELQAWTSTRPGITEITAVREELANIAMQLQVLERSKTSSPGDFRRQLAEATNEMQCKYDKLQRDTNAVSLELARLKNASFDSTVNIPHRREMDSSPIEPKAKPDIKSNVKQAGFAAADGDLRIELQCAKRDLQELAKEVKSIVNMLEIGAVTVEPVPPTHTRHSESYDFDISPVTALRSLREIVTRSSERLSGVEDGLTDLRLQFSALRSDLVDFRDWRLKADSSGRLLDAAITTMNDRLAEIEACLLLLAPRSLAVSQSSGSGGSGIRSGGSFGTGSNVPQNRGVPSYTQERYIGPSNEGGVAHARRSRSPARATLLSASDKSSTGPRWRETHPPAAK